MTNEQSGWHTFGKISAWTIGVGAAGAAIVGIGNVVYNSGFKDGSRLTNNDAQQTMIDYQSQLTSEGRLIPEDGCLRYSLLEKSEEISSRCDAGLVFTRDVGERNVRYHPKKELQFATQFDGIYTLIGAVKGQETELTVKRKENTDWETIDLKL